MKGASDSAAWQLKVQEHTKAERIRQGVIRFKGLDVTKVDTKGIVAESGAKGDVLTISVVGILVIEATSERK